jgi:MFS family permease
MDSSAPQLTTKHWLIIVIASIGFLFDTIAELLRLPPSNPIVTSWVGNLLTIAAVCGGVFGLLGGWLIDKFGRKTIMAASIFLYSAAPFCAAYATSLTWFVVFRSATFIGVCVEFVAAVTWLAEVFQDKKQKEKWLGITQAWRYLLMTGILPAIPIALLLPFVPESQVWREKKASGALKRPSFAGLFSPELRKVTLVTTILSACAYGIAFGALQVTVARVTPGLPELAPQAKTMAPMIAEAKELNTQLNALPAGDPARKEVLAKLKENAIAQAPHKKVVDEMSSKVQFRQEMGGLAGRVLLAVLLIVGISRVALLKVFQMPALVILPLTYFMMVQQGGEGFLWCYALCGLVTVAQFSYFGEYLPKIFPLHLRGTGGSFATNVGGRMIGTCMATLNTSWLAPLLAGGIASVRPSHVALAAGYIATAMAVIALIVGFFLPEPKGEE